MALVLGLRMLACDCGIHCFAQWEIALYKPALPPFHCHFSVAVQYMENVWKIKQKMRSWVSVPQHGQSKYFKPLEFITKKKLMRLHFTWVFIIHLFHHSYDNLKHYSNVLFQDICQIFSYQVSVSNSKTWSVSFVGFSSCTLYVPLK